MDKSKDNAPNSENTANQPGSLTDQIADSDTPKTTGTTPAAVQAELDNMKPNTPEAKTSQSASDPSAAPLTQNSPKKKDNKLLVIIIIVVLLLAAGLGFYLYHKSNSKKPTVAPAASSQTPSSTSPTTTTPPAAEPSADSNDNQTVAQDTERQTDINAVDAHLEAFYANQGYYPTLANMNTASWISANMKGLDPAWLQDPQGTSQTLVSAPQAKAYAYAPTDDSGSACDDSTAMCTKFTLTAVLSSGQKYEKTSH